MAKERPEEPEKGKETRVRVQAPTTAAGALAAALRRALLKRQEAEMAVPATASKPAAARKRARALHGRLAARPPAHLAPSKHLPRSPLAPKSFPALPPIGGVELGVAAAGIRYRGRHDMMLAAFPPGTAVAGVFTSSRTRGAPVDWCRTCLETGGAGAPTARALVVNAGNANVFTGKAGMAAVEATAAGIAELAKCERSEVFVASTGVIGEPMPVAKVKSALPQLWKRKSASSSAWESAARAIMTTDTFPKGVTRRARIDDAVVTINGIAKGSGMVAPDLATMLAFIFTDANLPPHVLQTLVVLGVRDTFNAITVDSDSSTSDMLLAFATQTADHEPVRRAGDPRLRDFRLTLHDAMRELAHLVVRDGEGASKFITVTVSGAESAKAARAVALSIANSPLVKTAIAGGDANWGRIVMAIGKAGETVDRDKLAIHMCGLPVAQKGGRASAYNEAMLTEAMKEPEIEIAVDLGLGTGKATIWTCDLTAEYIAINGAYRS
jgi:glutamate N-acetyltransferase/amino-acid N-acetyltransferase